MLVLPSGPPAHAAGNTLTVVASGGSPEGTGWSYSAGVISVSATVSINASDINAKLDSGNLTVQADDMNVNAGITGTTSNSLTLRTTNNIIVAAGVNISTQGGDITFQSDSDASAVGSIRLGISATSLVGEVSSNGGDIILSGGLNPVTGYAMASSDQNPGSTPSPAAGIASFGFNVQASGGDVALRGSGKKFEGAPTSRGVLLEGNTAGRTILETSGAGGISIVGDGSQIGQGNAWGVGQAGVTMRTVSGPITISGKADTGFSNARGMSASNATYTSTTGDITFEDTTNGTAVNYSGLYVGGTLTDISTLGNIVIRTDEYVSEGTLSLTGPSATLKPYTSQSFTAALPVGRLTATNCQNLVIGQSGNTSNVTFAFPVTVGGPAAVYGSNITFGATFSSSANLFIYGSGNVTQSAAIATDGLVLIGAGTFILNNVGNTIGVLAAGAPGSRTGSVTVTDASGGLTIGQVSSFSGVYSSANIDVSTVTGNLTLSQPVSSTAASGDSVKLFANKPAVAGSAGTGDILLSGSGSVSVESGARALLYSGTRSLSSGLLFEVGGETNARSLVAFDTTLSAITPPLGATGEFALFRTDAPAPTFTITFDANGGFGTMSAQSASGAAPLEPNTFTREGFVFAGWTTNQFGTGTVYTNEALFSFDANDTLYAQWTAIPSPSPTPEPNLPATGSNSESHWMLVIGMLASGFALVALPLLRRRTAQ